MELKDLRILIVGPRGAGKNTFAAQLHNELDCCQTFDIGTHLIRQLSRIRRGDAGFSHQDDAQYILKHKDSFRPDLITLADVLREYDQAALIKKGFEFAPVVVGVRTKRELEAYLLHACDMNKRGILIELRREGALLRGGGDNFELFNAHHEYRSYFASTILVENNRGIEELREWARLAAKVARGLVAA